MSSRGVTDVSGKSLAQSACYEITAGSCRGAGVWWSQQEASWLRARTAEDARRTTAAAIELCQSCGFRQLCATRAREDRYTGIAAGTVYVHGDRRDPDTVYPLKKHDQLEDQWRLPPQAS